MFMDIIMSVFVFYFVYVSSKMKYVMSLMFVILWGRYRILYFVLYIWMLFGFSILVINCGLWVKCGLNFLLRCVSLCVVISCVYSFMIFFILCCYRNFLIMVLGMLVCDLISFNLKVSLVGVNFFLLYFLIFCWRLV